MRDFFAGIVSGIVVFGSIVLLGAAGMVWAGYVASVLWGWFLVPLGVSAITYSQSIGLCCLFKVFMGPQIKGSDKGAKVAEAVMVFLLPLVALFFGWLVK